MLDSRADQVATLRERADRTLRHRLDRAGTELHHTLARLRALSPAATLERGYAIVQRDDDGAVLRDPADDGASATRCGCGWPAASWPLG